MAGCRVRRERGEGVCGCMAEGESRGQEMAGNGGEEWRGRQTATNTPRGKEAVDTPEIPAGPPPPPLFLLFHSHHFANHHHNL
ncbi:hypothetical protein E2C01_026715 [Portunus trituberculatus]|uniref:Uncharacterized protein n=1 Tax=Portunus trituberculatus TaxID=210409 RepID=A0A5B7EJD6_PORTR|nr:hypothetical protein [Portunus trituberculatus]